MSSVHFETDFAASGLNLNISEFLELLFHVRS